MELYLLIGQSNMAGRGKVDSLSKVGDLHILMLTKENRWVLATDPLHFDKKDAGVGPGLSFAKTLSISRPGITIGLIPCAVGGTSIGKWKPGAYDSVTNTHPYDEAITRAKVAMEYGTLKGILWHQGEGNSSGDQYKQYQNRFETLLQNLSKDLNINADSIPIVIGELGPFFLTKSKQAGKINEVLHTIATAHPNIICVSAEGLTDKGDKTHFDTPSARILGERYAEAMKKLQHLNKVSY